MMANYRNRLGYITNVHGIHVCGYQGDFILYQDNRNGIDKQKQAKLYDSGKGIYFKIKGKRVYLKDI